MAVGVARWTSWPLAIQTAPAPSVGVTVQVEVTRRASGATESGSLAADAGSAAPPTSPAVVPNARVIVFSETTERKFREVARGRTGEGGTVFLAGVPEGPAWVLAEGKDSSRVSRRVVVSPNQRIQLELDTAHALGVTVLDDQGAPIHEATALVRDADTLPFGALTDAAGKASFDRLGGGKYRLEVYARGFEAAQRSGVDADIQITLRRLGGLGVSVVDGAGEAVEEAEVYIVGSSLWPARRLQTDKQGKADLPGLLSGIYDLRARKGGRVSAVASGIRLDRGEHRHVELRLGVGRFVPLRVKGEKPESLPIENAAVVVAEFGLSPFPLTARTNSRGHASVGPLAPGPAFVSVRAEGYVGRGAIPVPESPSEPLQVVLMRGATLNGSAVDQHGHAVAGARVEIIGFDTDGLPIAETPLIAAYRDTHFDFAMKPMPLIPAGELGVTVGHIPYVNEAQNSGGWTELPTDYRPWISDVEGRFKAHPVPPGRVRALVRHPAYVESLSEIVELGPGGEREVTVVLLEGGRLIGRVVDERGQPVGGARVVVASTHGAYERSLLSERDGMFRLAAVPHDVSVSLARAEDPTRFVWRGPVALKDGQEREIEFTLPNEREALAWRVVDSDDQPIDLAQVTLLSLSAEVPLRITRFTTEQGEIDLADAAGLELRVAVRAPGFVPISEQVRSAPAERVIVMQRGVRVEGRVTAVRGRVDVAGARVTLITDLRKDSTLSNSRGVFEFDQVPTGIATLRVAHDEYAGIEKRIKVERTGRRDRAFELEPIDLEPGATVSGVVLDAEGEPVARARVAVGFVASVLARGSLPAGTVITDEEGRFVLRGVGSGVHQVSAVGPDQRRGAERLDIEQGATVEGVTIELGEADEPEVIGPHAGGLAVSFGERDEPQGTRVVIVDVSAESEAERAGLQRGDVLSKVDGASVHSMRGAREKTNGKAGTDVVLVVVRRERRLSFRVRREALSR